MNIVTVSTQPAYDVCIGEGLLAHAGEHMRKVLRPCRAAIVTDATVDALYGQTVEDSLRAGGFDPVRYAFPAGEIHKRLSTLEDILEFLAESQMTRTDLVVALGGGVVGDVAGFAAAVYARGIRFVQIPTTLLAAVDSYVGGKTAVDLRAGKNLAGCFHQPSLVLTDVAVMRALPPALLANGAGEIIKYGVLADEALFEQMSRPDWADHLEEIIVRSVSVKRDLVCEDEFDTGARRLLNLGHTFGHAIERCSDYTLSHGQAVAVGTLMAAGAANRPELCRAIRAANLACGLPIHAEYSADELARAALGDKKRRGDEIALVLPERIGHCVIHNIPVSELPDAFARGLKALEEQP